MKVVKEVSLKDFNFWSGAKDLASLLRDDEFDTIEDAITEWFSESLPTETDINDLFWFESDLLVECLGYDDFEAFLNERG